MNKTKRVIVDSAIKVFSSNGYNGATMDDIALNAGVAKGTLYYHFKSKEEIFKYIIMEGINVISEEISEATNKEMDSIAKLKSICKVQLELVYKNRDFFKVIMSQLWGEELRQVELREIVQKYIEYIEKYVQQAMNNGLIRKGESSFMAYTFFGTLCSAAVYELLNQEETNIEDVIDNLLQYILQGISV